MSSTTHHDTDKNNPLYDYFYTPDHIVQTLRASFDFFDRSLTYTWKCTHTITPTGSSEPLEVTLCWYAADAEQAAALQAIKKTDDTSSDDTSSDDVSSDGISCVVVMGAFDGVHMGHQSLFEVGYTQQAALQQELHSHTYTRPKVPLVAVSFMPDPADVFSPDHVNLMDHKARAQALLAQGFDAVCFISFTLKFSHMSYQDFLDQVLMDVINISRIVVGTNFSCGYQGVGTPERMAAHLIQKDSQSPQLIAVPLKHFEGLPLSASRIRQAIQDNNVVLAFQMLGRLFCIEGQVQRGRGEGSDFGFPTANVAFSERQCMPQPAVFAGYIQIDGKLYAAAISVGAPPSFDEQTTTRGAQAFLEAYVLGFSGNLYGKTVRIAFTRFLRDVYVFSDISELKEVISRDVVSVQTYEQTWLNRVRDHLESKTF